MEKKNFDISLFLGCCVVSIGIIVAGWLISKELPETTHVPSSLAVTTTDSAYGQFGEYLSQYEVAAYLGITDEDVVLEFAWWKLLAFMIISVGLGYGVYYLFRLIDKKCGGVCI